MARASFSSSGWRPCALGELAGEDAMIVAPVSRHRLPLRGTGEKGLMWRDIGLGAWLVETMRRWEIAE